MSISACCLIENCIIWMTLLLPSYSINVDRRWRRSYRRKGWCKWRYDSEPACHQNEEWCARSCNHIFFLISKVPLQIKLHTEDSLYVSIHPESLVIYRWMIWYDRGAHHLCAYRRSWQFGFASTPQPSSWCDRRCRRRVLLNYYTNYWGIER